MVNMCRVHGERNCQNERCLVEREQKRSRLEAAE